VTLSYVLAEGWCQQAQGTCGFVGLGAQPFDHRAQRVMLGQHGLKIIKRDAQTIFYSDKTQQVEGATTGPWWGSGLRLDPVVPHGMAQQSHRMPTSRQETCYGRYRRAASDDFKPCQCVIKRHCQGYKLCI
jgi:hypothetical protein